MTNGKLDFGNRDDLRGILNITDDAYEGHHKLPWTACKDNSVIQEAAKDGFHLNMPENGVSLKKYRIGELDVDGIHASHPKYDDWVVKQLNDWGLSINNNFTPKQANEFLQKTLIPQLDQLINAAKSSDKNLNNFFKDLL